jgi:dipeptidyl aminopeptidase/acylaminoacyl peptidase
MIVVRLLNFGAVLVCLTLATAARVHAAPSMRAVLQAAYAVRDLKNVDLAADGSIVVWQEDVHDTRRLLTSRVQSVLYIAPTTGSTLIRLTAGSAPARYDEENPIVSPDGAHIAFLSDARSKGQLQIFVADSNARRVRQIGRLAGNVQRLQWSPNGKFISFLYIADARRKAGALAAGARDVGVIGSVVDEQRLATIDVASGSVRQLTPPDIYVYEYGWSPDGTALAATYARGNGDNNWWIARLARVDAGSGMMKDLISPSFQIDDPQWSPDGRQIAVIGGIMSDFGSTGGDVYVVDAMNGTTRDVTAGAPFSAQSLRWNDASSLDVVAHVKGAMHLVRLDMSSGIATPLTHGDESIWSWSSAQRGARVALVRVSFDEPPEVWAGSPTSLRQVSHRNAGAKRLYGKAVSIEWKSDEFTVQGWLVYPLEYDARRFYPMIAVIHGGPSAQTVPSFASRNISALASQGYFVFMPNPRGSFGQGEAFTQANVKDFGYGDWRDDVAGLDAAIKSAPIDTHRLGLFGWSYGGYMAMWAETQTTRFKAIVAGAGVVNWQSYYGQNKIDQWMIPFFGASVYQDPAVYAKSSPITYIEQSKTPVLILQGERDEEVPAPQSFEFWHAMETLGIPTRLVVYADEGHGFQKVANQIDILTEMVAWFNRYV